MSLLLQKSEKQVCLLRESSFNLTRGGGGMKILRGVPKMFRHPKGEL